MVSIREASEATKQIGFASPIEVLSREEAKECLAKLEEYESLCSSPLSGDDRFKIHLLLPWAWELVHHPVLVDLARRCLSTDDIWCWSSDLNIKEPSSRSFFTWHQDSTYAGFDPPSGAITVWLALSQSTVASGCLLCIPSSHRKQLTHEEGSGGGDNALSLGQEIKDFPSDVRPSNAQPMPLQPGEASVHSFLTVHASRRNTSDKRRSGLAIRYVSAHCTKKGNVKETATLVSGNGRGLFDAEPRPLTPLGDGERAAHSIAMERERINCLPQGQTYR